MAQAETLGDLNFGDEDCKPQPPSSFSSLQWSSSSPWGPGVAAVAEVVVIVVVVVVEYP